MAGSCLRTPNNHGGRPKILRKPGGGDTRLVSGSMITPSSPRPTASMTEPGLIIQAARTATRYRWKKPITVWMPTTWRCRLRLPTRRCIRNLGLPSISCLCGCKHPVLIFTRWNAHRQSTYSTTSFLHTLLPAWTHPNKIDPIPTHALQRNGTSISQTLKLRFWRLRTYRRQYEVRLDH